MVFDLYDDEEQALASFGCIRELRHLQKPVRSRAVLRWLSETFARGRFSIHEREVESVTILDVSGDLVYETSSAFRERMKQLIALKKEKVLLNLERVTRIDTSGLGNLISAYATARSRGTEVKFVMSQTVRKFIDRARLY
jgi:anti-sigma B factor antagonist